MQAKQLMNRKTVCHISYHPPLDDRIYWKELITLQAAGYATVHLCVSDADADYITAEGIRIIEIERKRIVPYIWLNRMLQIFLKNKGILKALLQKAAGIKADIYHYHDLQINAIVKELKQLPQRPKLIYDVHEAYHLLFKINTPTRLPQRFLYPLFIAAAKRWELLGARYCDYIIATDEYTLTYFEKKLPAIPKAIVYNYSYFLPVTNTLQSKKYHFIYSGSLDRDRGIQEIIKATALLAKEFEDVKVLLIGPFPSKEVEHETISLIETLQLTNCIEWHKPVPFADIHIFYEQSYAGLCLLQANPKFVTAIPIKLFEYMAFGLPVIFSNHGPSAQIIKQANCGLLVEPDNITAICQAMKHLLNDKEQYHIYSRNAQKAVSQTYHWNTQKEKLLAIYEAM